MFYHRMYFANTSNINVEQLNKKLQQQPEGENKEYTNFILVELESLINSITKTDIQFKYKDDKE